MRLVWILLGITTLLWGGNAYADVQQQACCRQLDTPRWYFGLSGQLTMLEKSDITNNVTAVSIPSPDNISYGTGFGISGAIGYKIYSGVRTEFEMAWRSSKVSSDPNAAAGTAGGNQTSTAFMTNVYLDLHNDTNWTPYVGTGVGVAYVQVPREYQLTGVETLKLAEWTWAYQFMLGVNYETEFEQTPVEVTIGYRYFTGQDATTGFKSVPGHINFSNNSQNLELGSKFFF